MEGYKNIVAEINVDWGKMTDEEIDKFILKLNKALWRTAVGGSE